ncbi:MAG: M2 family metallopeptidase [Planctomycetia bacterium]|nr:M2 family metallopeptidase [Planctomycetia bacterium]
MPSSTHAGDAEKELAEFMQIYQSDYLRMYCEGSYTWWDSMILGTEESFEKAAAATLAMSNYHADPARYTRIKELRALATEATDVEKRAAYVAEREFEQSQIPPELNERLVSLSSEIEQIFQTQRAVYNGQEYTNNELLALLEKETDSQKRYEIWDALKQVGELVAPKMIELAKLRNEAARKLGYKNYWEMTVSFQEFTPDELIAIFEELEEQTRPYFVEMKDKMDAELKEKFGVDKIMPWHYDNPFFQQAPPSEKINVNEFYQGITGEDIVEISKQYYAKLGFDVTPILENSDLFEKEGKSQHGFCNNMNKEGDVRILCNIKPDAEWMDTQLHELGHAIYDYNIDRTLPPNIRDVSHIFTTEGIAMTFGAKARDPQWLIENRGLTPERAEQVKDALIEQRLREQLIFCRWTLVMTFFEKALYENPEQDLNTLWGETTAKYQLLDPLEGRGKADWASKPHFVIAPVYYHCYMLGELFGAQVRNSIEREAQGDLLKFGQLLKERVFEPGNARPWEEFVENATGEPLSTRAFIEEIKQATEELR